MKTHRFNGEMLKIFHFHIYRDHSIPFQAFKIQPRKKKTHIGTKNSVKNTHMPHLFQFSVQPSEQYPGIFPDVPGYPRAGDLAFFSFFVGVFLGEAETEFFFFGSASFDGLLFSFSFGGFALEFEPGP